MILQLSYYGRKIANDLFYIFCNYVNGVVMGGDYDPGGGGQS